MVSRSGWVSGHAAKRWLLRTSHVLLARGALGIRLERSALQEVGKTKGIRGFVPPWTRPYLEN